jgi:hypothetical protein
MTTVSVMSYFTTKKVSVDYKVFWNVIPYDWYLGIIGLVKSAASSIRAEVEV